MTVQFNQITLKTGAKLSMPLGELHLEGSAAQQEFFKGMMEGKYDNLEHAVECFNAYVVITKHKGGAVPYEITTEAVSAVDTRTTADGTTVTLYANGLVGINGDNDEMAAEYANCVANMTARSGTGLDTLVDALDRVWLKQFADDHTCCEQFREDGSTFRAPIKQDGDCELLTPYFSRSTPRDVAGYTGWVFDRRKQCWSAIRLATGDSSPWYVLYNGEQYRLVKTVGDMWELQFKDKDSKLAAAVPKLYRGPLEAYLTSALLGMAAHASVAS